MTNRETGLLTFRVLSIYALIRGLEQIERVIRAWPRAWPEQDRLLWQIIVYLQLLAPLLVLIIFSLALWKLAPRLTNRMFASDQNTNKPVATLDDVKSLVFAGIGLYLLVDTIPDLVQTLFSIYASLSSQLDSSTRTQVNILRLRTILKLAVGFWLLLGAKGLSNIISKIKE
jgi:hypothetical protein